MQREEIDAVLSKTVASLVEQGADPAEVGLALSGAKYALQAEQHRIIMCKNGMLTRDEARAKVETRIFDGNEFTSKDLEELCPEVEGMKEGWRIADQAIQRLRRKRWIYYRREGRAIIWALTNKGQIEAQGRAEKGN